MGSWEVWLRRGGHHGRRATLVDLNELEAGSLGVWPEELPEANRVRLSMMTRPLRRAGLAWFPVVTTGLIRQASALLSRRPR